MAKLPFHERLYTYGLWSSYILFALTAFGLWNDGEAVLSKLEFGLGIYISLFLIYNFNPYNDKKVDEFGRGIAFSAGILLLLTKGLSKYLNDIKQRGIRDAVELVGEFAEAVE
jgi:hypothetical protein